MRQERRVNFPILSSATWATVHGSNLVQHCTKKDNASFAISNDRPQLVRCLTSLNKYRHVLPGIKSAEQPSSAQQPTSVMEVKDLVQGIPKRQNGVLLY